MERHTYLQDDSAINSHSKTWKPLGTEEKLWAFEDLQEICAGGMGRGRYLESGD